MKVTHVAALLAALAVACAVCDPADDLLKSVPRYKGPISFRQYAGYIPVDKTNGRYLYYWFAESQRNPSTDPVVLWLNGGPGCSSLDGLFYEHGPFHFAPGADGTANSDELIANPYSYNLVANMIYLEAPAGVGMSYSDTPSDYSTNDNKTALDNYQFLENFFTLFPEFQKNDFYISGESYAGIYVPTLAYTVHEKNQDPSNLFINLKGIIVGNGVTNEDYDSNSFLPFAGQHGLYSPYLYREMKRLRCFFPDGPLLQCAPLKTQAHLEIGNVNIYGIYNDCYSSPAAVHRMQWARLGQPEMESLVPPCLDATALTEYLNDPSVRADIHAQPIADIGQWTMCAPSGTLHYKKLYNSIEPLYDVLANNYRVLIYSGDTDGAVPYVGTVGWIANFQNNTTPLIEWNSWKCNGQTAGYYTVYPNMVFTTAKGAGHMVPQDKPAVAYQMFSQFLDGNFPTST